MLPTAIDRIASRASICCQSAASAGNAFTRSRTAIANAASLGPEPITSVTGVGAPW
jgi:hypothetical protein